VANTAAAAAAAAQQKQKTEIDDVVANPMKNK